MYLWKKKVASINDKLKKWNASISRQFKAIQNTIKEKKETYLK